MVKCGPAETRACNLGLVVLGFRVRDKVRISVKDRVGVRVGTFYFLSHALAARRSPHPRRPAFYP